jgi:hypothetical protein
VSSVLHNTARWTEPAVADGVEPALAASCGASWTGSRAVGAGASAGHENKTAALKSKDCQQHSGSEAVGG